MKKITKEELNEILRLHKMWLNKEDEGIRADLSFTDLAYADLSNTNLTEANLNYTDLTEANLNHANLTNADLTWTFLWRANLSYANLSYVDLTCSKLDSSNLTGANLKDSDLIGTKLNGANLTDTILDDKEKIRKGIVLKDPVIGYKKCRGGLIVTLEIPKGATVLSINNYKRRTNKAKVIKISGENTEATSYYDENFIYHVGETIEIEDFDFHYNIECSNGIHFFSTEKDAMYYIIY